MKRRNTAGLEVEDKKIDAFLTEIVDLGKRYGFSIWHEDDDGFEVHKFSQYKADCLMKAADGTGDA